MLFLVRLIGKIRRDPDDVGEKLRNWCYAFTKCFDRISYRIRTTMTSALCIVYERCVALGFHADIPGEQMFLFAMLLRLRGNYLGKLN